MNEPEYEVCKHRDVGMDGKGSNPIRRFRDYDIWFVFHSNHNSSIVAGSQLLKASVNPSSGFRAINFFMQRLRSFHPG